MTWAGWASGPPCPGPPQGPRRAFLGARSPALERLSWSRPLNPARHLLRSARLFPRAPALFHGTKRLLDYAGLAERAARIAGFLRRDLGLSEGERVAIYMNNTPEYLELLQGVWWAGMAVVPVNARLHPRELAFILEDSAAALLLVSQDSDAQSAAIATRARVLQVPGPDHARMLRASPLEPPAYRGPDDLAWLFYTSGTTGRPKGVMQTTRNLAAMTACYFLDVDDISREDATIYAAPFSHGAGMYNLPFILRAARHVVPESGGFDPTELHGLAQWHGRACLFAAPTMVRRLVESMAACGADPGGFKTLVYGGGPMYLEDIKHARYILGNRLVQIYGQGESPMTITCLSREQIASDDHPNWEARLASVGVAQSLVEVRVANESGAALPPGETGEVLVRGDAVMAGYWRNEEATRAALREGWLWTGDLGTLDAEGFLTLKDRSKDLIISGGSNVYPREIEEVLLQHPRVHEVSVVGRRDAQWGEAVVAFVVGTGVSPEELDALCLENIARFKRPKQYRFVQSLPKNNYGKVLKTQLRAELEAELTARAPSHRGT